MLLVRLVIKHVCCLIMTNSKMKKLLYIFILFITTLGFSQSNKVKVEVDTTAIRIGEQFNYKLIVDEIDNVIIPELSLKGLEVVDSTKTDTLKNQLIKKYILTGFDSGAFYIPQQQIFIKNQAHLTDSLLINVATIPVDTTKIKKFPIKGIKSEPYTINDFRHLWWILVVVLAFVTFLVYWMFFRKEKDKVFKRSKPALPPYEEALQRLKQLDEKLLWQNNKVKQYYSELTDVVRNYIERELNVTTFEKTSDEILNSVKKLTFQGKIKLDNTTISKLNDLLTEADLVKFAKSKPMATEIEQDRKDAEEIINDLKPKPVIEDENVE